MPDRMTIGEAAKILDQPIHRVQYAVRNGGAPRPRGGKVGNRWLFSPADVRALQEWFSKNRKHEPTAV